MGNRGAATAAAVEPALTPKKPLPTVRPP